MKAMDRAAPVVSVIVPAYNAEATVLETIASVTHQTFSDFELIVIDDGSTDRTLARVRSVRDPRVRILTAANRGVANARNRGIASSAGEFISFIDADDMWTPDKLELQLDALRRRPGAALAYSWTAFVDSDGRFLFAKEPSWCEGDVYLDLLRGGNFIASGSNMLVRRSCAVAVGGFDVTLEAAQDLDFCLRIAARWQLAVVPRYQILYRISQTTMSANAVRAERNCLLVRERAFGRAAVPRRTRAESLSNVKQHVAFLYLSRKTGLELREVGRRLAQSIRLYPPTLLRRKTWHLLLTWSLLAGLPSWMRRRAVMTLLRMHGRWSWLCRSEVRRLVTFSGNFRASSHARGTAIATHEPAEANGRTLRADPATVGSEQAVVPTPNR